MLSESPFKDSLTNSLLNGSCFLVTFCSSILGITSEDYISLLLELFKNMIFVTIGILGLLMQYWINYEKVSQGIKRTKNWWSNIFKFKK